MSAGGVVLDLARNKHGSKWKRVGVRRRWQFDGGDGGLQTSVVGDEAVRPGRDEGDG